MLSLLTNKTALSQPGASTSTFSPLCKPQLICKWLTCALRSTSGTSPWLLDHYDLNINQLSVKFPFGFRFESHTRNNVQYLSSCVYGTASKRWRVRRQFRAQLRDQHGTYPGDWTLNRNRHESNKFRHVQCTETLFSSVMFTRSRCPLKSTTSILWVANGAAEFGKKTFSKHCLESVALRFVCLWDGLCTALNIETRVTNHRPGWLECCVLETQFDSPRSLKTWNSYKTRIALQRNKVDIFVQGVFDTHDVWCLRLFGYH